MDTRAVPVAVAAFFMTCGLAYADPVVTTGTGSAVTRVDRAATFDSIGTSGLDLSGYAEDLLSITIPANSLVGLDFFAEGTAVSAGVFATRPNTGFVTIATSAGEDMEALELRAGNAFEWDAAVLVFETYRDGIRVGGGSSSGNGVFGFASAGGFDELRIGAGPWYYEEFGQTQAIALDDLSVQLLTDPSSPDPDPSPVPEPSTWALLLIGALGLILRRRRPA